MLSLVLLLALHQSPQVGSDWTQFHGGSKAGVFENSKLPTEWSTKKNVAWATDIPGLAWSCPVTWKGKVFLTSVVREGTPEVASEARKGLYFGGEGKKAPESKYIWKVYCLDEQTGKILWEKVAHEGKIDQPKHVKNSYASETQVVVDAERLYVCFGNIGLFTYDHEGKELWKYVIPSMPTAFSWGPAASQTVYGDRLYFVYGNQKSSYIVCLDARTGSQVWKKDRDEKSNWATPYVWVNDKRTEIVTAGTKMARSYDLDGNVLWEVGGMSTITVPTPFAADGLLYVSSGYVMDQKKPLYAIKSGASGDLTTKADDPNHPSVAWVQRKGASYMPTPLVYQGLCYVLYDQGFIACYDAKTGAEVYGKQRFKGKTSGFTASPWAYNGKIFCLSEDGDCFVVRAGREFKQLGINSMEELCMATPAITEKSLLIRTASKLYCIR